MTRSLVLAAFVAVLSVTAVQAAPAPQVQVAFGDLNLADPAARAVLMDRVQSAAAAICGPVQYSLDLRGSEVIAAQDANARCVRRAVDGAITQIDAKIAALPTRQKLAGN